MDNVRYFRERKAIMEATREPRLTEEMQEFATTAAKAKDQEAATRRREAKEGEGTTKPVRLIWADSPSGYWCFMCKKKAVEYLKVVRDGDVYYCPVDLIELTES